MSEAPGLRLCKCLACHARFVPDESVCPRCAAATIEGYVSPGIGTVLAATALEVPPPGWARPHPLALIEVEDGVRLLALPDPPVPEPGERVQVRADGEKFRSSPIRP